jgi:hypothetical protein
MKTKLLGVVACMALLGVSQAVAATITYNVDIVSGSDSATGTITTDGTIGVLSTSNITDWNLLLTIGSSTADGLSSSPSSSFIVDGNAFTASPTGLFFNFGDTTGTLNKAPYTLAQFNFISSTEYGQLQFVNAEATDYNGQVSAVEIFTSINPIIQTSIPETITSPVQIASTTPLPAALPLFATGLGAMGLLGWRRKRKNNAAIVAV